METLERRASSALPWLAVAGAIALIVVVALSDHATIGRHLNAFDDPRPGARIKATPEQIERTQAGWRKRKERSTGMVPFSPERQFGVGKARLFLAH